MLDEAMLESEERWKVLDALIEGDYRGSSAESINPSQLLVGGWEMHADGSSNCRAHLHNTIIGIDYSCIVLNE